MPFTSSSSRSAFSSSKGFSSKLRSALFCANISFGRINNLRDFMWLRVSGSLKESFLRGLGVDSKFKGLPGPGPGPGLPGEGSSVGTIIDLNECLSMVLRVSDTYVRLEFSRVHSCGRPYYARSRELHFPFFIYLEDLSPRHKDRLFTLGVLSNLFQLLVETIKNHANTCSVSCNQARFAANEYNEALRD